jgi:hypothetical protein
MRRRIRCDLGRPSCSKCIKKGFNCPGYGRHLRWADGVAVRGKLKGQRLPVAGSMPMELPAPTDEDSVAVATSQALQAIEPAALSINKAMETASATPSLLNFTLWASSPDIIEYYDKNLAGRMVWIDSEENDRVFSVSWLSWAHEIPNRAGSIP